MQRRVAVSAESAATRNNGSDDALTTEGWPASVPSCFSATRTDGTGGFCEPCSATGTFRRHPDVLHRIGERQIAELVELQTSLLGHAAKRVKPGGIFVYATCSLEPDEGEAQAAAFLESHADFVAAPIDAALLPGGIAAQSGQVRALPGMYADQGGLDGFFVAAFVRNG